MVWTTIWENGIRVSTVTYTGGKDMEARVGRIINTMDSSRKVKRMELERKYW